MTVLINNDGSETTDQKEILKAQHDFYSRLYTADPNIEFRYKNTGDVKISEEQREDISKELTIEELTTAVKQSKKNCSPGCDGLTGAFYVVFLAKSWEIVTSSTRLLTQYRSTFSICIERSYYFNPQARTRLPCSQA